MVGVPRSSRAVLTFIKPPCFSIHLYVKLHRNTVLVITISVDTGDNRRPSLSHRSNTFSRLVTAEMTSENAFCGTLIVPKILGCIVEKSDRRLTGPDTNPNGFTAVRPKTSK